jgi:F-type H+-transporting ATPase subunit epsilon
MADGIKIDIVSPERLILSVEANAASVPGQDGYFTVMGDHAPMMTTLKPGFVTVTTGTEVQTYYVRGGFADVSPEGLTILAEEAKTGADFDKSEIEAALKEAEATLAAAEDVDARARAQTSVDGWRNLLLEAAVGPALH